MIGMDSTGGHIEKLGSGEGGEACQMTHMLNSWKTKQYLEKEKKRTKKNKLLGLMSYQGSRWIMNSIII